MSFTLDRPVSSQGKSDWPKGVFIDRIKITEVVNKESSWNDCNIQVIGEDVSGKSKYPKKFFLGGKHKKDGDKFVNWGTTKNGVKGGSWKVRDFLIDSGVEKSSNMIETDGSLTQEVLDDLIGREVYMLQYESNGKYSRETWFYFAPFHGDNPVKYLLDKWNGFDDKPDKYLHSNKTEIQNKKLNTMWENLPDNKANSELDDILS